MANRLSRETSPYLLSHAKNPVDWYPWGPEALERAEREDKPILLSIGYAACHWCHVMERESFENPAIAALMNRDFVCIKVDREERPDLDDIYMTATIAISGSGGWPMTVFLTPEQTPFFAGTYFPPEDQPGRPGLVSLLGRIRELWNSDRDALFRQAGELTDHIRKQSELGPPQNVHAESISLAVNHLRRAFDEEWGGFSPAPKFPPCPALHLLLREYQRTSDPQLLHMVTHTLDKMAAGGIRDHLAGGFARYSVDERWLAPHFEKMLYDNALLARVYTEAFQVTKKPAYEAVVRETLDFVIGSMQAPGGGYFSAIDADSEGVEGKYYVFSLEELQSLLTPEQADAFCGYYNVRAGGNWEGTNILNTPLGVPEVAKILSLSEEQLTARLTEARAIVLSARNQRVKPLTDDKILVGWNALMISAMAEAGRVFSESRYVESARRAAGFIEETLAAPGGRLLRTARGTQAHIPAYLEDYAYLSDALVDLYEASGERAALDRAQQLGELLLSDFYDSESGAFFQTATSHESLIVRTRDGNDGALPNAGSVAAKALARLAVHVDRPEFRAAALSSLRAYGGRIERMPRAFLTALSVADFLLQRPIELVFAGGFIESLALRQEVAASFLPHRVIAYSEPGSTIPLLAAKTPIDGKPALYICKNFTCQAPITLPAAVAPALSDEAQTQARSRDRALASARLGGAATASATRAYLASKYIGAAGQNVLGKTGLAVSRIGFGAYRVHESIGEHQQALQVAFKQGCNLVDTAATYTGGGSERSVSNALSHLVRTGELSREQLVVVSKLGLVEGEALRTIQKTPGEEPGANGHGMPFKEVVTLGPGLGYCLHETWLASQLSESLGRLGLETLDVCLIHNPEMLLNQLPKGEVLKRLTAAFQWLEGARGRGQISWYGVSSNALGQPSEHGFSVAELVAAAESAGAQGFAVIELPLNPLELQAEPSLREARKHELGVLVNRPLNGLRGDELVRLCEAPEDPAAPDFAHAVAELGALEEEFRSRLGAVLGAVPELELDVSQLFAWSERIGEGETSSRELWNDFERGVLAPQLSRTIAAMDRAFAKKSLGEVWQDFRGRYTQSLEDLVLAARQRASVNTNRRNQPILERLKAGLTSERRAASLSQLVLWGLSSDPDVSTVLVGIRTPAYVHSALSTLNWAPKDAPLQWLKQE